VDMAVVDTGRRISRRKCVHVMAQSSVPDRTSTSRGSIRTTRMAPPITLIHLGSDLTSAIVALTSVISALTSARFALVTFCRRFFPRLQDNSEMAKWPSKPRAWIGRKASGERAYPHERVKSP